MRRLIVSLLALALVTSTAAQADNYYGMHKNTPTAPAYAPTPSMMPKKDSDLISFEVGYLDFDKTEPKTNAADFRFEYRFGYTFIGGHELGFHPFLGFETTSRNMLFGLGGFAMDWNFAPHGIFTWTEGAGYLDAGDQRSLGGTFQFRSGIEAGYRFDNDMRVTAQFSHISDAKLTRVNPGAEIIGMYLHVPTSYMFGVAK